jgi:threonine 3-dehydrogenase
MGKEKILIIGAGGQIGSVLMYELAKTYGRENVIASDLRIPPNRQEHFEQLDVLERKRLYEIVDSEQITQIYHLAAILSASGEANPLRTWDINMNGLFNVLEVARERKIDKVFFPSSIAVFGKDTPAVQTPQHTILNPTTIYGMSKVAGEHWAQYYHLKYGMDIRSLRYPGIIGYQSEPGGGTTDYAVDIYHKAIKGENYTCFLQEDTTLPMIYMEDAIRATVELMEASAEKVKLRTGYNLSGMSFSPKGITAEIQRHYPAFEVTYAPDFRQQIAESWPQSIDDSVARGDWGWMPKFDLEGMTGDMILNLKKKYGKI